MVNQQQAIDLCKKLYEALKDDGYFPALTGGQLYKTGKRKDVDIVIYRHRQMHDSFEMIQIEEKLKSIGLYDFKYFGFVTKAKHGDMVVDLFNPESTESFSGSEYEN